MGHHFISFWPFQSILFTGVVGMLVIGLLTTLDLRMALVYGWWRRHHRAGCGRHGAGGAGNRWLPGLANEGIVQILAILRSLVRKNHFVVGGAEKL